MLSVERHRLPQRQRKYRFRITKLYFIRNTSSLFSEKRCQRTILSHTSIPANIYINKLITRVHHSHQHNRVCPLVIEKVTAIVWRWTDVNMLPINCAKAMRKIPIPVEIKHYKTKPSLRTICNQKRKLRERIGHHILANNTISIIIAIR